MTTTDEHFGLLGPLATPAPGRRRRARARRDPRSRDAPHAAACALAGDVDDRADLARRELREETGVPVLVDGAQSVGAIPVDAAGFDFLTISGQNGSAAPTRPGRSSSRIRTACESSAPSYFSQADYEPDGSSEPRPGAARFDPGWWSASSLAGLSPRSTAARPGPSIVPPPSPSAAGSSSPSGSKWSSPPRAARDPRRLPNRRRAGRGRRGALNVGVHVREIPNAGLIRCPAAGRRATAISSDCSRRSTA